MTAQPRRQSTKGNKVSAPVIPTAAGWKAAAANLHELVLPSGYTVKIKRLGILEIAEAGHMDLSQTSGVLKKFMQIDGILGGDPKRYSPEDLDAMPLDVLTEANMSLILKMFRQGAVAAVVLPKVAFPPEGFDPEKDEMPGGTMNVMEIPYDDLQAIWNAANERGPRRKLDSFRGQPK